MNKLSRYYIGYKVNLSKILKENMYKNNIKDKCLMKDGIRDKYNFNILINEIQSLNNTLSYWLGDTSVNFSECLLPKALDLKVIKIDNFEFFEECELIELINFDKQFLSELNAYKFEREVFFKKKEKSLNSLDIDKAISYVKLIDSADEKIAIINKKILEVENLFRDKYNLYLTTYNQFVSEISSKDIKIDSMYKNTNYTKKIVGVYRINKICDMIVDSCLSDKFYELFENSDIKNLLGSSYFQIKQKVNKYVGANS